MRLKLDLNWVRGTTGLCLKNMQLSLEIMCPKSFAHKQEMDFKGK